ncbi:MAG: hypothetical protein K0R01_1142 [Mycobacterium sp.]|nr:hypothetical protein [Mycobacterium sp.]
MRFGVYTAVLHDMPLPAALSVIRSLGLEGAEVNAGGFLPTPHLPVDDLLSGRIEPAEYLTAFEESEVALTGLNVNGNPLHADPEVGPEDAEDLRRAIRVASLLGVDRVVTMSGLPAAHRGGQWPAWHVNPWDSGYLDSLDYQWDAVAVPFWREIDALARDLGVKVCIEMHPQNLVFNPPTLERLVDRCGATNVGAEMDPSHLFWQGIDPVAAIDHCQSDVARRSAHRQHLAGGLELGLRRRRPRTRRRVLGALSVGTRPRRPRHRGQHRARGRRTRPTRGSRDRRNHIEDRQCLCSTTRLILRPLKEPSPCRRRRPRTQRPDASSPN